MAFERRSRGRLTPYDLARFPGETLFDRVGRAVCAAGCLPRKELYEAWEIGRRVRRRQRGGRVVDVAGGHGLLAHLMLLLDDTSPEAIVLDTALPPSREPLHAALTAAWPRLRGRVSFLAGDAATFTFADTDVVVSSHACGALTDTILDAAAAAHAPVAVLPCCHDLVTCDTGPLDGWLDGPMAIDVMRATRMTERGYRVWTQRIPEAITPKNRLLIALPPNSRLRSR